MALNPSKHPPPSKKKRNYTQKTGPEWQCRVCRENYEAAIPYCMQCYQALYYYCYINAELFVEKDLAYLPLYYLTPSQLHDSDSEDGQ